MIKHKVVVIVVFSFVGCTANLQRDINSLNRDVNGIREYQADAKSQLASLAQEMRELRGRVEELEYGKRATGGSGRRDDAAEDLRGRLSSTRKNIEPPRIVPTDLIEQDEQEAFIGSLDEDVASRFQEGLLYIREGNFSQAITYLQSALDANAGKSTSGHILFWLGVSYEGVEETRNALRAYNDLVASYPRSERSPRALLRQGSIFSQIGDKEAAKITYTKVVKEYKDTAEAEEARRRMSAS
jgi:TolA-binding protein